MKRTDGFAAMAIVLVVASLATAAEMERARVADDKRTFVLETSGKPFYVWGVNYDHDVDGRLIEDYWHDECAAVAADFREMRELGANAPSTWKRSKAFTPARR